MYTTSIILSILISLTVGYKVVPFISKLPEPYSFFWNVKTQDLFVIDTLVSEVCRLHWPTNNFYSAPIEGNIVPTFIVPVEGTQDKFLISSLDLTAGIISWDGQNSSATGYESVFTIQNITQFPNNAWNYGRTSPNGILFYSTADVAEFCVPNGVPDGILTRYKNHKLTVFDEATTISGNVWNPIINKFYYINSCTNVIIECNWNPITDDISGCHPVFHFHDDNPQVILVGLTIDTEGFLYTSAYNGGYVLKVNPRNGKIVLRIDVPAETVADVAFVGPNLDNFIVSTETVTFNVTNGGPADNPKSPLAGSTFRVDGLYARGFAPTKWNPRK